MRMLIFVIVAITALSACSKKSVPSKTSESKSGSSGSNSSSNTATSKKENTIVDSVSSVPVAPPAAGALIVIDGYGKILTPASKLPAGANLKPDYSTMARAFTPQQQANLKARYKTVPPKVLYVPDAYAIKSLKGTHCVYKKKFWYWKKEDGLFYLDQMYYQ